MYPYQPECFWYCLKAFGREANNLFPKHIFFFVCTFLHLRTKNRFIARPHLELLLGYTPGVRAAAQ